MAIDKEPHKQNGDSFESTTTPTSNETLTHAVLGPKYLFLSYLFQVLWDQI